MFLHCLLSSLQNEDSRSNVVINLDAWVSMLDFISSNSAVSPSTPAPIYATPLSIVLLRSELMLWMLSLAVFIDYLVSVLIRSMVRLTVATCDPMSDLKRLRALFISAAASLPIYDPILIIFDIILLRHLLLFYHHIKIQFHSKH